MARIDEVPTSVHVLAADGACITLMGAKVPGGCCRGGEEEKEKGEDGEKGEKGIFKKVVGECQKSGRGEESVGRLCMEVV